MKPVAVVLLVDDEPHVTEALKRALRREPYEFLTATSGEEGQRILDSRHVDVVISDEQMPGMSGSDFLVIVRKRFPRTIRMILSGRASLEAVVRAINEGGVYRYFLKPCDPTDLLVTIRQALQHSRLEEQSRRLLREYQRQASLLVRLEHEHDGSALLRVDTDEQGAVIVAACDEQDDLNDLLTQMERAMNQR
jgi:two-component system probable response regulator PhcQ